LFLLLTTVSGIGPKLALSVLSSLPVTELVRAIQAEDVDKLETVPGIGKKSAGRIALELKDKVSKIQPAAVQASISEASGVEGPLEDALSALVNLGYRPQDAKDALRRVTKDTTSPIVLKNLIREGLKELARG
jgi:Holliday junction DNA helicase RuvA